MKNKCKVIFFDVDDTLFDRKRAQHEILQFIVQEFHDLFEGIEFDKLLSAFLESDNMATSEFYAGGSFNSIRIGRSKIFLKILGLSEDFAEEITKMYVKYYPRVNTPVNGAKFVIETLSKNFKLGVISNGVPDVQYQKLETLGIRQFFDCIILSEEIGIRKPDPRIFWKATELLKIEQNVCLYVGNSFKDDVIGAKNAGMLSCWFNSNGLSPLEIDVKPDFEISELDEIFKILG